MAFYTASAWAGRDVLTRRPNPVSAPDEKEELVRWDLDSETGIVATHPIWRAPARSVSFVYQLQNRTELADARTLIEYLAGRWRGIWVPSWHHDLVLAADIGVSATQWTIHSVGFEDNYLPDQNRRHLFLTYPGLSPIYRYVLAATDNGNGTETLDVPFDQDGTENLVALDRRYAMVSLLRWMRLDADEIEIERHTRDVHSMQIGFVELPHDIPTL